MIIRSTRVVLPDGVIQASIHLDSGRIARIGAYHEPVDEDFGDLVVSPGLVDTHVHVNEPGRTEWEGFDTATRAAAAGGVTTLVDMPLNSVPATTTAEALEAKRSAARGRCHVDVAFWGGLVPNNVPGNARDVDALDMLIEAGVRGFKCFLVPSGVDEFPHVDESDLREALPILARRGVPLLVHAESPNVIQSTINPQSSILNPQYGTYLATRPPEAEVVAIRMIVRLARELDARVHIVHVASAEAAAEIEAAKADGIKITGETCPHYLTFDAETIPDGATQFKCAPPIREARHRDALWDALGRGVLDLIATDHSPAPPSMKCPGDFMRAWGGVASLELSLPAVWTALANRRGAGLSGPRSGDPERPALQMVARWMSESPAALAGLDDRKGRIATGFDADLVVWDPDAELVVDPSRLQQRHKLTPYAGRTLRGVVHAAYLRGERVWDGGQLASTGEGRLL